MKCPNCGYDFETPKNEMWVIEFTSPDPALTFTNAYESRQKALEAAGHFIQIQAQEELDGFDWEEPEAPTLLKKALDALKNGRLDDAVEAWLEFQDEFDPDEKISLGPSGETSGRSMDFHPEPRQPGPDPAEPGRGYPE